MSDRWSSFLLAIALVLVTDSTSFAQSILTIAGGGDDDYRPATLATLGNVGKLAIDASGNLYLADVEKHRIRKIAAGSGIITTYAGTGSGDFSGDGGAATAAQLNFPHGLALDGAGNLYIADFGNRRVRKVDARSGIISTVAGTGTFGFSGDGGPATAAQLKSPDSLVTDSAGNLYICDFIDNRIRRVSTSGIISTFAGSGSPGFSGDGGPATLAQFQSPYVSAVDSAGNLYITDRGNFRIRRVSASTGTISTIVGNGSPAFSGDGGAPLLAGLEPEDVAIDASGNLYVTDAGNHRIRKISGNLFIIATIAGTGTAGYGGDGDRASVALLNRPAGITIDGSGNVLFVDLQNYRVRRIDGATLVITTIGGNGRFGPGGDGGIATAAQFKRPTAVTLDSSGNLYVVDEEDHRIRKVAAGSGVISSVAGTGASGFIGDGTPATTAQLSFPSDAAFDASGNLYIADSGSHRIRRIDAGTGLITTVAGSGVRGFRGDGGPATEARLDSPGGVILDVSGNLYFGDSGNNRVRKVAAGSGIITTIAGNGSQGSGGDGGPATNALLSGPTAMSFDHAGNLYITDSGQSRIRKVTIGSGIITTVAGNGRAGFDGDGAPATSSQLSSPSAIAIDSSDNLYIADRYSSRIRRVDAATGIMTTVAGNGSPGFSGDGSAATAAELNQPTGVAVDASGNLYIVDMNNARVRAVFACVVLTAPSLVEPSNDAVVTSTSPRLAWSRVAGAFRYDVYLDTRPSPQTRVATELVATVFSPSNLEPNTTYYWRVDAKGDSFCSPARSATSEARSFSTTNVCAAPTVMNQ